MLPERDGAEITVGSGPWPRRHDPNLVRTYFAAIHLFQCERGKNSFPDRTSPRLQYFVRVVKDIIVHVFSGEWMEYMRTTRRLIPRETDTVSRITAGYKDQAVHFVSRRSTSAFRMDFICMPLLLALSGLGPSALILDNILLRRPTTVQIADLTWWFGKGQLPLNRAELITRLKS